MQVNRTANDSTQDNGLEDNCANFAMIIPDLLTAFARKDADFIFPEYSQHNKQN